MRAVKLILAASLLVIVTGCDILAPSDPPITSVTVSGPSLLNQGDAVQFQVNCGVKACPSDVTWISSDQSIATVTSAGRVTAVAPGNSKISASV